MEPFSTVDQVVSIEHHYCLSHDSAFASLEDEYTPKYCAQLEAAYGRGMMSEGGESGIEYMFEGIPLANRTALDIGSGLGGVAFYLSNEYQMNVTGLEVNPWLIQEARKRIPDHLNKRVTFLQTYSNNNWALPEKTFDIIYSKGVFTHLETKGQILKECYSLLKDQGLLIITDWLSSDDRKWGENIKQLVELENLALFPESESGYVELLKSNGFTLLSVRDDSPVYFQYNQDLVDRLRNPVLFHEFMDYFTQEELEDAAVGYESIARAIQSGELRVLRFVAQKRN